MRARYKQRLTPDDVGKRVSIRRWVEDEERGTRPTDVVGRLVQWADDELVVRTREDRLVAVYVSDIVTSRVVPEHPRLQPEGSAPPQPGEHVERDWDD